MLSEESQTQKESPTPVFSQMWNQTKKKKRKRSWEDKGQEKLIQNECNQSTYEACYFYIY